MMEQLIYEDSAHLDSFFDGNSDFRRIQKVASGNSDAGTEVSNYSLWNRKR